MLSFSPHGTFSCMLVLCYMFPCDSKQFLVVLEDFTWCSVCVGYRHMRKVALINALEPGLRALPDQALAAKTGEFRGRLARGESLDALLPEAFAVVREAATRVLGMRHYDVQLVGCLLWHAVRAWAPQGKSAV